MATLFTKIINGELPGRFVYRDDRAVAFLTIAPLRPGHTLVVPVEEVDHWLDAPAEVRDHLMAVAHKVGVAQQQIFNPTRVALIIAGLEVPHLHLHVVPIESESDLNFAKADADVAAEDLDRVADLLRTALEG